LDCLSWFCLVPLFFSISYSKKLSEVFRNCFLGGIFFFVTTYAWLHHVTWIGYLSAVVYQSFFWIFFGAIAWPFFQKIAQKNSWMSYLACVLVIPILWTGAEVFRSIIPVMGMPWALLAHSQNEHLAILQSVSLIGEQGLTLVMAVVNGLIWVIFRQFLHTNMSIVNRSFRILFNVVMIIGIIYALQAWGQKRLEEQVQEPNGTIGVIQGNVPQDVKWDMAFRTWIIDQYTAYSRRVHKEGVDLIIWPEAAFPDYFERSYESSGLRDTIAELKTPFLIGTPFLSNGTDISNSALLVNADASLGTRYDKIHLVPFGEYVPLGALLFFVRPVAIQLGVGDFKPGHEHTVFSLEGSPLNPFSTLICFEDMFSATARKFIENGADWLLVITNDAWFKRSSGPYQHRTGSVLRAIENGVWVARCANTGLSCLIDPYGRITDSIHDEQGEELFVSGSRVWSIGNKPIHTYFASGGWRVGYLCFWLTLLVGGLMWFRRLTR